MALVPLISQGNLLLARIPGIERQRMLARCASVDLARGEVLSEQGARIRHVYFPTGGLISLIATSGHRHQLGVGLIGMEGMWGASLLLGPNTAPLHARVHGAGAALRMDAAHFSRELRQCPTLQRRLSSYLCALMSEVAQMVVCTRFHDIEARLARWLLMSRDLEQAQHFYLTHELIASLLAVRRVGITRAAGALKLRKLIRYSRGHITIVDGRGLEAAACACYSTAANSSQAGRP